MGRGVNVAEFIQQAKDFSSENKRSTKLIADVKDKVLKDRSKIDEFERENPRISKWRGLPDLKDLNRDLFETCKSCAEDIRENAENQKKDYRYILEAIVEAKRSVPDFLQKHGLRQYISSLTKFGYEDVEGLLDAEIEKDCDLADNRCRVVLDEENRLEMGQNHLEALTREIDNLRQQIANIPQRMKNIISSADKAAKTSQKFLNACQDTVDRARSLKDKTETPRQGATRDIADVAGTAVATGLGAVVLGTAAVVTGVGAVAAAGAAVTSLVTGGSVGGALVAGAAAVGLGAAAVALGTLASALLASLFLFSDLFQRVTIEALKNHQRDMDEKARRLERQWLNEIHTCVTMMESNNAAVKHKFMEVINLPSSVGNIRSTFDTIFENLDTLTSFNI
ncbi:Hypp267 [Branchiostoma lanceolatum]|uniref:Hypp267 protein n=1 Tax=Branchiostoma lanceolatum TaxID=7740 RepID=A0A8J9V8Q0_BRALA|nr:Hypp267 [Branchiostoma lanceolatum]